MAFDLMPLPLLDGANAARGDLLLRSTAAWQRLPKGGNGQVLAAGTDDTAWTWRGWVQRAIASTAAHLPIPNSARIPGDDSMPQQSEGTEILTVSITPKSAASLLRIQVDLPLIQLPVSVALTAIASLYRDATADPIRSKAIPFAGAENQPLGMVAEVIAGSMAATSFKLRIGPVENYSLYLHGGSGGRLFGGALTSLLIVDEFAP